jgi:epoxyqueuosine reductase QueG
LGKSGLLITPEYKAMIRLVTLLTDLPLPIGEKPLPSQCGVCCKCLEVCPVKAIKEDAKDFNRKLCYKYLQSLVEREIVEDLICGLCIKVCEGGKSP